MKLKPYQACRSTEGWTPIDIPSDSVEGRLYRVMVCPWENPAENICECPAYLYRAACKHQVAAQSLVCSWTELQERPGLDPFTQNEEQRKNKVCPRCGGQTMWRMEVEDDEDSSEET